MEKKKYIEKYLRRVQVTALSHRIDEQMLSQRESQIRYNETETKKYLQYIKEIYKNLKG